MVVNSVSYSDLVANETLMADLESTIQTTVAQHAGASVAPSDVHVVMSAGSVNVAATLMVPAGHAAADFAANLANSTADGSLAVALVANVQGIQGIDSVTTGTISVVAETPVVSTQSPTPEPPPPAPESVETTPREGVKTASSDLLVLSLVVAGLIICMILFGLTRAIVRRTRTPKWEGHGSGNSSNEVEKDAVKLQIKMVDDQGEDTDDVNFSAKAKLNDVQIQVDDLANREATLVKPMHATVRGNAMQPKNIVQDMVSSSEFSRGGDGGNSTLRNKQTRFDGPYGPGEMPMTCCTDLREMGTLTSNVIQQQQIQSGCSDVRQLAQGRLQNGSVREWTPKSIDLNAPK